jgi:TnpA family transposase
MPRRSILSATERDSLFTWPKTQEELIRQYTLSQTDLSIIRQHRGVANRLGYAVQLCSMRYPGVMLAVRGEPFPPLLRMVATQLGASVESWTEYAKRAETRREHAMELQAIFGFQPFTIKHYRAGVRSLQELALQTDKGLLLASALIEGFRRQQVLLPTLNRIERICAEAVTRANRSIYSALSGSLMDVHRERLDNLLKRKDGSKVTLLAWLRQSPAKPNSRHMLEHIERLRALQILDLPAGTERQVHQNRLLKIAREGGQMTSADLAKFEPQRRYATLVAVAVEATATVTDEVIDLHDRIIGKLFNTAKHKHQEQFQTSGKAINDKVLLYGRIGQVLLEAKRQSGDAFAAIESVISWDDFASSVTEAQKLASRQTSISCIALGKATPRCAATCLSCWKY